MQVTLAAWTMAVLSPSALMVVLVRAAIAGQILLFGLIAGAVADTLGRCRVIQPAKCALIVSSTV